MKHNIARIEHFEKSDIDKLNMGETVSVVLTGRIVGIEKMSFYGNYISADGKEKNKDPEHYLVQLDIAKKEVHSKKALKL